MKAKGGFNFYTERQTFPGPQIHSPTFAAAILTLRVRTGACLLAVAAVIITYKSKVVLWCLTICFELWPVQSGHTAPVTCSYWHIHIQWTQRFCYKTTDNLTNEQMIYITRVGDVVLRALTGRLPSLGFD